jgi:hypothetical protein
MLWYSCISLAHEELLGVYAIAGPHILDTYHPLKLNTETIMERTFTVLHSLWSDITLTEGRNKYVTGKSYFGLCIVPTLF